MDSITSSGPANPDVPDPPPEGRKRHFDTFETQFFKQGDDVENASEVDGFEDLDDGAKRRQVLRSRLFAVVAGGACLAVLGCVALWRSGNHPSVSPETAAAPAPSAPAPSAPAQPVQAPAAAAQPEPSPPPAPQAQPPHPNQALETKPPAAQGAATPPAAVAPAPSAPAGAAVATAAADKGGLRQEQLVAHAEPTGAAASDDVAAARARCKQAVSRHQAKEIQSACEAAFDTDPTAADVAVLLAKTEFDKGRSAQAAAWSRKALAADPNAADAYVFLGGAEQSAGRTKAAKEAYKRYLQLAPTGRYAADLRAIVGSL
jgi:Flp pilus assembly protein TadD